MAKAPRIYGLKELMEAVAVLERTGNFHLFLDDGTKDFSIAFIGLMEKKHGRKWLQDLYAQEGEFGYWSIFDKTMQESGYYK